MAKLNFKTYGEGYPVIILHGLFGSLDNWQTFAKKLVKDYMVFTIDQRDHGRSPHTNEFNYTVLAEDLKIFMEEQWIHEANIIGHSMGGKVAMEFALEYPEMVKKLVIVDIAPFKYKPQHVEIMDSLKNVNLAIVKDRNEIDGELSKIIKDNSVRQFLMKNFKRKREGGYELKINLPLLMENYSEINKAIQGESIENEILFVKGENSDYILDADLPALKKLFPNAMLKKVPNSGHWVHSENPEFLIKMVQGFLKM